KLRSALYEQTVRIKAGELDQCATVFDLDKQNGVARALTLLREPIDTVTGWPMYYRTREGDVTRLYEGKALKGNGKRAHSGVSVIEFPLGPDQVPALNPRFLPLATAAYDYSKGTYITCGWSPTTGVTAPCSALQREIINGFSTIYATPQEGWRGSGYYS